MKARTVFCVGAFCLAAGAGTLTIAPGDGVFTNVTARITGETDVEINSGDSGGGMVRLNASNGYVGKTTVNCGTLLVDSVAETGNNSSVGASGDMVMGRGTFLYNGPDGGVIDRDFTNNVTGRASIYNISNELWITGNMRQVKGSFVKTGPGTLHLAGSGTNIFYCSGGGLGDSTSGLQARFVPNANGDAPSKGYRHFHVLEGTLVLGEGGGTYLISNGGNNVGMGGWLAADGEQEKEAHLEVRGGTVSFESWVMFASYNGKTSTTPDGRTASSFRIYDGDVGFSNGGTFCLGRNKLGYSTYPQNIEPHFEMYGGTFTASSLSLSDDIGANSVVLIHGGTATLGSAFVGRVTGSADTTVLLEVANGGRLISDNVYNAKPSVLNVHVLDGGVLQVDTIQNKGGGKVNVLVDGGTVIGRQNGTYAQLYANLTSVKIGGKGAVVGGYGVARTRHAIEDAGDGAAELAGLVISNVNATSVYEFGEPAAYRGPTLIKQGLLSFCDEGALPSATTLTVAGGGVQATNAQAVVGRAVFGVADTSPALAVRSAAGYPFMVTNSFALAGTPSLQVTMYEPNGSTTALKTDGTYPVLSVPLADRAALEELAARVSLVSPSTATSAVFSVAETADAAVLQLAVAFPAPDPVVTREQTADTWTNGAEDGLWATGGNWASGSAVNAAGATATFPELAEGASYAVSLGADGAFTAGGLAFTGATGYTLSGGTLSFDNGTDGAAISSVGGASHTISSEIAGSWPVKVNPAATGAGKVALSNLGSGFTGRITTGSGTTELGSLAFVKDAGDLVVGPGTLKYTGTGETIPGFTINAGSGLAAIVDVENDLTVQSMEVGTSSLIKAGAGDLVFKGNGTFALGNTSHNAGNSLGIGMYGDSPLDAIQGGMIANGRLVIGTVGDDADAPTVSQPYEMDIGGRTASPQNGRRETVGELIMNNGVYSLGCLELGYYAGATNVTGDAREDALVPRLEVNGGEINCTYLSTAWDWTYVQNIRPEIAIHGGTVNVSGQIRMNSHPSYTTNLFTTWTQDGGAVTSTSMTVGSQAGATSTRNMGELLMNLNGGTLAVNGTTTFYNNAPVTINVNEGAVFQSGTISTSACTSNTAAIYFRGGRYCGWTSATGNTEWHNHTGYQVFLADDLVFDTSANEGLGTPRYYWTYVNKPVLADPEAGRTDFGITVVGGGRVAFGTVFADSTITGAITASEGSTFIPLTTAFENATVAVEAGGTLQQYNVEYAKRTGATIKNLTLGTAGESGVAYLDIYTGTVDLARTNYAFAVTGDLTVNGPVAVTTHSDNTSAMPAVEAGVYTALVYQASISLDVSKFTTGQYDGALAATYKEVTLSADEPDYPGWHALVCTVTSQSAVYEGVTEGAREWSAVSAGGNWSASANWNNFEAPNGTGDNAVFRPASAAAVPVTLDTPVTVRSLKLAATSHQNGYRLSGEPLTVTAGNPDVTVSITANSGTNTFANDVAVESRTLIQTAEGSKTTFDGAFNANDNVICVNYAEQTGGGTVEFKSAVPARTLLVRSGRMILPSVAGFARADAMKIGGGTLKYTGTGETAPGLYLHALISGVCSVLDVDHDLTIRAFDYAGSSCGFSKIGEGDLIFKGNGTFRSGTGAANRGTQANTYVRANGDGPIATFRRFNLSEGRIIQGTVGDPDDAPDFTSSDFCIGVDTVNGANCEYVMNNGTMSLSSIYVNYYHGVNKACTGKFTINGGTVNGAWLRICQSGSASMMSTGIVEMNGGELSLTQGFYMGYQRMRNKNIGSFFYMNGGTVNIGTSLWLVYYTQTSSGNTYKATDGYVHMNGGTVDIANTLSLCNNVNNTGRLFLNGGTISAKAISYNNGKAYVTFNGGTLGLKESGTLPALTGAYVSTNGAIVSVSQGVTYTFGQALVKDPLLSGAADGGFTKTGPGTLVLSGANTFTGPTTIAGGVLQVTTDDAISDQVVMTTSGVLDCAGATRTVGEINMLGVAQNGSLRVSGALAVDVSRDLFMNVDGDLVVDAGAKLDVGLGEGESLDAEAHIPLAYVSGAVSVPGRVKVLNGGKVTAAELKVVDGMLYAVPASSGTMVIVR